MKTIAIVLALALYGCGGEDAAGPGTGGTGGSGTAGAGGSAGTTGTGGASSARGGGGGAAGEARGGAGGGAGAGIAGASGGTGPGGTAGGSGAAGSSGAPPTCDSFGWTPGNASLCGASKGQYACASCFLPGPPRTLTADCVSNTAFQSGPVLCVDVSGCDACAP